MKKFAIVGTGGRHQMFRRAVTETHAEENELVALCDINPHRLSLAAGRVRQKRGNGVPTYAPDEFGQMIADQQPDTVIVTVPDYLHDKYIVAALRAGCNVMTEKPMTIDLAKLKSIIDAQRETGKSVTVTFNYRYTPARTQLKDLLMNGAIGEITAVDFSWHLDRVHGADYFRRWHRYKDKSGGLLVHKSTHHFDLINWWLASHPTRIRATGKRAFYTPEMAEELGLAAHGPRCHGCPVFDKCEYRLDLEADEKLSELYLEAEDFDGYYRDRCVFDADITIEDTMQVQADYASGVSMNYTLCAYSPWEGLEIRFYGTLGEITHKHVEVHGVFGSERDRAHEDGITTTLHLHGHHPEKVDVPSGKGDHGGGDAVMLGYLFDPEHMEPDLYNRSSNHVTGAWSILTGIAANLSIESGAAVDVADLLRSHGIVL